MDWPSWIWPDTFGGDGPDEARRFPGDSSGDHAPGDVSGPLDLTQRRLSDSVSTSCQAQDRGDQKKFTVEEQEVGIDGLVNWVHSKLKVPSGPLTSKLFHDRGLVGAGRLLFAFRGANRRIRLVFGPEGGPERSSDAPEHQKPVSLSVSSTRARLRRLCGRFVLWMGGRHASPVSRAQWLPMGVRSRPRDGQPPR